MRRLLISGCLALGLLAAACSPQGAECRSDAECSTGETCVSGGGVFVGGGRCVPKTLLADAGPFSPPVDADHRDIPDGASVAPEDADTSAPRPDGSTATPDTADGGADDAAPPPDVRCPDAAEDLAAEPRCEGADDDCDGVVDEGCPCNYNGHAKGVCSETDRTPDGVCKRPNGFSEMTDSEACDQLDNDCDGAIDEGCSCDYRDKEAGVCADSQRGPGGDCREPAHYAPPTDREPCDGKDNDCDGAVDEGSGCSPGTTKACYTGPSGTAGVGICRKGTQTCGTGRGNVCIWQPCKSEVTPKSEDCTNGKDDNCNGSVDEATLDGGEMCTDDCQCYSGDCRGGRCAHRIFVNPTFSKGDLGGLSGADSDCQSAAQSAGLEGTWKAVLSTSNKTAKTRLDVQGAVVRMDGTKVADSESDLWDGKIEATVTNDASGSEVMRSCWTGTDKNGGATGTDCNGWTSAKNGDRATFGYGTNTDAKWIHNKNGYINELPCDIELALYCIDGQ